MRSGVFADYKIFTGNSNPAFAEEIAGIMGKPLGKSTVTKFSDGEISVNIWETVRGLDVYIIQSTCSPVNDNLMELLIMIDAMKRASAGRINAIIPYYGYARQDRKAKARDPITAKLVADLIMAAGADRVLTMDLHANQIQGYFDIPVDHLLGMPILAKYFKERHMDDLVVVSPDHGSVTRARNLAQYLNCPIAIIDKRRPEPNKSEIMNIIGNIEDKNCIIIDDMIDTAGTICNAANAIKDLGARSGEGGRHSSRSFRSCRRQDKGFGYRRTGSSQYSSASGRKEAIEDDIPVSRSAFAEAMTRVFTNGSISVLFD